MNWLKIILFLQILLFSSQLAAQNKQLDKANKRYQIKKYAEAIPLYEEGLEKNPNLSARVRLAYCYRINNDIEQAVNLYSEIVKHKRAKPITWYYYGEALMSQGKYDEAKVWLEKYTERKPGDPKGFTLLESIDKVQTIEPYYVVNNVESFAHNSESDDSAPVFFRDGIAFSSDRRTGAKIMKKKSSFTGRDFLSIFFSKKNDDGTYKSPRQISKRLNDLNKNTGTIALSPDGTFVVFSRNSDVSNRRDQYNLMLYSADVTEDGRFRNVKLMEFCNNNSNHMHPTFSPDGKTLFFTSDKSGVGGTDIFYSKLGKKGWSRARNLDAPVNTTANEGFPFMSSDGKLFFCSKGHTSYGGFDIFVSQQDEKGNWSQPSNIGQPINSPADDISIYISKDGKNGMFASSREGGDDDIYLFDIDGLYNRSSINMMAEKPAKEESIAFKNSETKLETSEPVVEEEINEVVSTPSNSFEIKIKTDGSPVITTPTEPLATKVPKEVVNTPIESAAAKVETENIVNNETTLEVIDEVKTSPTKTEDLPFAPIEPFDAKVNSENIASNESTTEIIDEVKTSPTKTEDLPFAPTEPFDAKVDSENIASNESITEVIDEVKTSPTKTEDLPFAPIEPFDAKTALEENSNIKEQNETLFDKVEENGESKFEDGLASIDAPLTEESNPSEKEKSDIEEMKEYLVHQSPQEEAIFILEKMKFAPQQYVLTPEISTQLEELVILMNEFPEVAIEVTAHTESIGDDRENMIFSIKRATAIAGYLIRRGIATDRVQVMGYGETQLLNHCSNGVTCSDEEHAINQRVELKILNQ